MIIQLDSERLKASILRRAVLVGFDMVQALCELILPTSIKRDWRPLIQVAINATNCMKHQVAF